MMEMRLISSGKSWIFDQSLPENTKREISTKLETSKPWNLETKKPRSQENKQTKTKKPRNQFTNVFCMRSWGCRGCKDYCRGCKNRKTIAGAVKSKSAIGLERDCWTNLLRWGFNYLDDMNRQCVHTRWEIYVHWELQEILWSSRTLHSKSKISCKIRSADK